MVLTSKENKMDTIKLEIRQTYNSAKKLSEIQKLLDEDMYMSNGDLRILSNHLDKIPCYGNQFLISTKLWIRKQIKTRMKSSAC